MNNWKKTKVWRKLEKIKTDEADNVRALLLNPNCLPKVENILKSGTTSPKDFTLHDADHSFRVVERMWEIIPENTKKILSEYELALLLLSAYLHDIGMTPEHKKVNNHFVCLNSFDKDVLTSDERKEFQKWLDEEGERINLEKDVVSNPERVEELVTFYCRYKHNDWSEEWIRSNFKTMELGKYTNWINDLVDICRSHHYGLAHLKLDNFNPLRLGKSIIHKRYIAMCLRLADIMEIDPERAPEVLIKHRSVIKGSLSHWLKEKFTSVQIVENSIIINASPDKAFIHKAICDIADQIEQELILCNTLKSERPLCNISPSNNLKHEWNMLPSVYKEINAVGGYEFIDGTFKPNSKKLIQLLAGTELYGNPILAIRELIQNSLDAVKIQMAYKGLEDGFTDVDQFNLLKSKHYIELSLTNENDEYWITCKDSGVGMDKEIIKKCFLVGGASKRREILELERKCDKIGYKLELTGQFGIGVMSYFMLADKLIIKTKKSRYSANHEVNGWEFEIDGLSDFGELRRVKLDTFGTTVRLRIKKEFVSQIKEENQIELLLENNLFRLPCNFKYIPLGKKEISYSPGWSKSQNYFRTELIKSWNEQTQIESKTSDEFLSEEEQSYIETSNKRKRTRESSFIKSIDFLTYEGKLENANGYFRISVPVFKNKEGDSFAYFFEKVDKKQVYLEEINGGFLFLPSNNSVSISWKGIAIGGIGNYNDNFSYQNCFVELDLINDESFNISVSRLEINYSGNLFALRKEIKEKIEDIIVLNKKRFTDSVYSFFNNVIAECLPVKNNNLFWVLRDLEQNGLVKFEKLKFPLIFDISSPIGLPNREYYKNKPFYRLDSLKCCGNNYRSKYFEIKPNKFKLDKAVFHEDYTYDFRISFLILKSFQQKNFFRFVGNSASFPPSWEKLICFRGHGKNDIILNENSKYFKYINKEDFMFVRDFFNKRKSVNEDEGNSIIQSVSKSFCFMLYLISLNEKKYWDGITKNDKSFVKKLWNKMFTNEKESLCFFHDHISGVGLTFISIDSWTTHKRHGEIEKYLPFPEDEWRILKRVNSRYKEMI